MNAIRSLKNPIIRVQDVKPTSDEYEVVGVFNPGVTEFHGKTVLLLRVAQRPKDLNDGFLRVPVFDKNTNQVEIIKFNKRDENLDFSDSRVVRSKNGEMYLTSFSFFRVAVSQDGEKFDINQDFAFMPQDEYETFGVEDPHITKIDETYYINYVTPSPCGIITRLMKTNDFINFERMGNMMSPDNKDVSIFPEKIGNYYYSLHRPSTSELGKPEIWLAKSPDLLCWGDHKRIMKVIPNSWEENRIGASAVPIKTDKGWLLIYHGADKNNRYCLGSCLLDLNEPWKVIGRGTKPFLVPKESYETNGFFCDVVFSCGAIQRGADVDIYYGAADKCVCRATVSLEELIENAMN